MTSAELRNSMSGDARKWSLILVAGEGPVNCKAQDRQHFIASKIGHESLKT